MLTVCAEENTISVNFKALRVLLGSMKHGEYVGLRDYDDPGLWYFVYKMDDKHLDLSEPIYVLGVFGIDMICRACHNAFTLKAALVARNLIKNDLVQFDLDDFKKLFTRWDV